MRQGAPFTKGDRPSSSAFLGREVEGLVIPLAQWADQARSAGLSDYALDTLLQMFRYYDEFGFYGNGHVLEWLLGRSPATFADFLRRTNLTTGLV